MQNNSQLLEGPNGHQNLQLGNELKSAHTMHIHKAIQPLKIKEVLKIQMSFSKLSVRFIQKAKGFSSYDFLIFLMQNCYIFQTELKLNIELLVKPKGLRQTEAANIVTDFVHKTKPLRAKPISKHGNLSKTAQSCSQATLHSPPTKQINRSPTTLPKSLFPLKLCLLCKHPLWYKNSFFIGLEWHSFQKFLLSKGKEQERRV